MSMKPNLLIGKPTVSHLDCFDSVLFSNLVIILFTVSKDVDIGELASLTDTNDVIESGNNVTLTELRKTWNQKYVLKYVIHLYSSFSMNSNGFIIFLGHIMMEFGLYGFIIQNHCLLPPLWMKQ